MMKKSRSCSGRKDDELEEDKLTEENWLGQELRCKKKVLEAEIEIARQ
jgi:hypothetical protein